MTNKHRVNRLSTTWFNYQVYTGGTDRFGQYFPPVITGPTANAVVPINADDDAIGSDLPGWRQVFKKGGNAQNSYTREAAMIECEPFNLTQTVRAPDSDPNLGSTTLRAWGTIPLNKATFSVSTLADNQAKTAFVTKASNFISAVQGGTVLGELRETIEMFRKPCMGFKHLTQAYLAGLKKSRPGFKRANRQRKERAIAEQYLEYTFGVKPLLSDIKSAGAALSDIVNQRNSKYCVGFGLDEVTVLKGSNINFMPALVGSFNVLFDRKVKSRVKYYGAVEMDLGNPGQFSLDKLGLNWPNFLPTVWELIPWSFIVDYFANVGNIVQAVSFPTSRLRWWGNTVVGKQTTESTTFGFVDFSHNPRLTVSNLSLGKTTIVQTSITRRSSPSLVPSLGFHIPTGVGQWTNMLALAVQARAISPY